MTSAALLPAALALDLVLGDPRALPHPVRLLGAWYALVERRVYRDTRWAGVVGWLAVVVPAVVTAGGVTWLSYRCHAYAGWVVASVALWLAIAARDLASHARRVERPLSAMDLVTARRAVGMIVGRDTASLDESEIARAAVEAVAESAVDGVVAPLVWGALGLAAAGPIGGAAAAWLYRAANTLDSAWGHRTPRYENYGWLSARADDALGLLPARLAAALIVLLGCHPLRALRAWRRDAHRHASPNAGRAEAAMAGALDVRLGGTNAYDGVPHEGPIFNALGHRASAADIGRSVRLMLALSVATTLLLTAVVRCFA